MFGSVCSHRELFLDDILELLIRTGKPLPIYICTGQNNTDLYFVTRLNLDWTG